MVDVVLAHFLRELRLRVVRARRLLVRDLDFVGELVLLVLDAVEEQRTKAMSYGMSLLRLRAARAARAEGGIAEAQPKLSAN